MKRLNIYKENDEFTLERINEFNHATKRVFLTEEGLLDALEIYIHVLDQYDLNVSDELWAAVIYFLNRRSRNE
ncbi:hypothetical protein RZN25_17600 [Bacillaceae bacterium S4-13-56]